MAAPTIKPTRMELLRLKKRTRLAQKGHKLLKDKRDGLMRSFLQIMQQARELRQEADSLLAEAMRHFILAEGSMLPASTQLLQALQLYQIAVTHEQKNIMGVRIPEFGIKLTRSQETYPVWETSRELDIAMRLFRQALPLLLDLAAVEKSAELLAQEIEKTRRRVNALEHVLIPQLKRSTKYIRMRLDEQERAAIITSIALKRMLVARG